MQTPTQPTETTTFAQVTTTAPASSPPNTSIFNLSKAQQIVQLAITIASIFVVLAGLWLATRISPLVQDIALVKQAAAEQDRRIEDMKTDLQQIKINTDQTKTDVAEIKGLLQGTRQSSTPVTRASSYPRSKPQPSPNSDLPLVNELLGETLTK